MQLHLVNLFYKLLTILLDFMLFVKRISIQHLPLLHKVKLHGQLAILHVKCLPLYWSISVANPLNFIKSTLNIINYLIDLLRNSCKWPILHTNLFHCKNIALYMERTGILCVYLKSLLSISVLCIQSTLFQSTKHVPLIFTCWCILETERLR